MLVNEINTEDYDVDYVGRIYYNCENLDLTDSNNPDFSEPRIKCTKDEANLISSECKDGLHRPVIDIDISAKLVPSTTPGNSHLYIDKPITWAQYEKLLLALTECGIVQLGFYKRSCERKATFVRPPWVKKEVITKTELRTEAKLDNQPQWNHTNGVI